MSDNKKVTIPKKVTKKKTEEVSLNEEVSDFSKQAITDDYLGLNEMMNKIYSPVNMFNILPDMSKMYLPTNMLGNLPGMSKIFSSMIVESATKAFMESTNKALDQKITLLPLGLISSDFDKKIISDEDTYNFVLENEKKIIGLLKDEGLFLFDQKDNLSGLFYEGIKCLETRLYLGAQSLYKDILNTVRDERFVSEIDGDEVFYVNSKFPRNSTISRPLNKEQYSSFKEQIKDKEFTITELELIGFLLIPYARTDKLKESGYDLRYTPSRNASAHTAHDSYSKYNALCFALLCIYIMHFCYKSESRFLKEKENWANGVDEFGRN